MSDFMQFFHNTGLMAVLKKCKTLLMRLTVPKWTILDVIEIFLCTNNLYIHFHKIWSSLVKHLRMTRTASLNHDQHIALFYYCKWTSGAARIYFNSDEIGSVSIYVVLLFWNSIDMNKVCGITFPQEHFPSHGLSGKTSISTVTDGKGNSKTTSKLMIYLK